jgi:hypothetical protein
MQTPVRPSSITIQLVLLLAGSRNIAVVAKSRELPCIQVPVRGRIVPAIHAALWSTWQVRAFVLRQLSTAGVDPIVFAAELRDGELPSAWEFITLGSETVLVLPTAEHCELERLCALPEGSAVGAIGWDRTACTWVQDIVQSGLDSHCGLEQFDGGDGYALLRFVSTAGKAYWLKATGSSQRHELGMTSFLSRLEGRSTPEVVAVQHAWNAWLVLEDGSVLSQIEPRTDQVLQLLGFAVRSLGQIQLHTLAAETELFSVGAFDQRLERLCLDAAQIFEVIACAAQEADAKQQMAETENRLAVVQETFVLACDRALDLEIPSALLHGDLNLGNLAFSSVGCRLLDWNESYVGFPMTSLQHLLLLNPIRDPKAKSAVDQELASFYRSILAEGIAEGVLEEGWHLTPMIAAVSALYGRGDWISAGPSEQRRRYPLARAILRHLDRETNVLMERSNRGATC